MINVALKGLAARKVRALLTALAVVIGVSMVSGTFVLTDTMQKSFDGLFTASYEKTDAVIQGKEIVKNSLSGNATVPAAMLEQVRALPEVAAAGGTVSPQEPSVAEIIGKDGEPVAQEGIGASIDPEQSRFSPLALKTGSWPKGPHQVVIDAGTAKKQHQGIGDTVTVATFGAKHRYQVTGTATFGGVNSLGFASIAVWDVPTAQSVLHREGRFDQISIAAKPGTSPAELAKAVKPLVPAGLTIKTSDEQAKADSANLNEGLSYMKYFLLGFGGIALFVGAFVIFNTLSITVAQRTREFATLRTLGASRKQVMRSVRLEGLVIGLLASVLGLVAGIGIAKGMTALLSATGLDLPDASMVIAPHTIVISLVLGTVVTLLATVIPARRATRVPPIAAVREGAALPPSRLSAHSSKLGAGVLAASVATMSAGIFGGGLSALAAGGLIGAGTIGLFLGMALVAPRLVTPLARLVGWPARRAGGVAGELATANAVRNPGRTASTAAALMIGLTLVTVVAMLGSGLRSSAEHAVSDQVRAAYVLEGEDGLPFRAEIADDVAGTPGVEASTQVRSDSALIDGKERSVTGIDPATIDRFYRFEWSDGSGRVLADLGRDGALVTERYADAHDLAVGSRLSLESPSGDQRSLIVRGIYDPPAMNQMLGDVSIPQTAFDDAFPQPQNSLAFFDASDSAQPALQAAAKESGDATLDTGEAFAANAGEEIATMLAMLYVLLGFSVVVSLFGMVNTLVLSVFERTRELGMLRAIGMSRRQARRMIRHESIVTALIGAALGLSLGIGLAALVTQALSSYDIGLSLPVAELVTFTGIAALAGVGAAILPARRASKLNVLEALHFE